MEVKCDNMPHRGGGGGGGGVRYHNIWHIVTWPDSLTHYFISNKIMVFKKIK